MSLASADFPEVLQFFTPHPHVYLGYLGHVRAKNSCKWMSRTPVRIGPSLLVKCPGRSRLRPWVRARAHPIKPRKADLEYPILSGCQYRTLYLRVLSKFHSLKEASSTDYIHPHITYTGLGSTYCWALCCSPRRLRTI